MVNYRYYDENHLVVSFSTNILSITANTQNDSVD